jgi:predicted DCC family thiol-disulfide oxidoreductase YuxK
VAAVTATAGAWSARRPFAGRGAAWYSTTYSILITRRLSGRGVAALRIGYGSIWVAFLLNEYGERNAAWGPGALWSPSMDRQYAAHAHWNGLIRTWFTALTYLTQSEFECFYLAAIAVGLAFALGWHSRATSVLFAIVVATLENRSPLIADGGDNVLILMAIYLAFTACGDYWSLDARRRAGRTAGVRAADTVRRRLPDWTATEWWTELARARSRMVTVVHNGAVLVIAAQICLVYGTAGFTKVQGSMWQDGSALAYVLRLDWFHPWPGLSAVLAAHPMPLALVGYLTVFVQAGFPFIVFSRRLKYPALVVLVMMHLSIMVLLGLPFFSMIMIVGDAVFLSDRVWAAIGGRVAGPAYAGDMAADHVQVRVQVQVQPTLVFDGDCAFCSSSIRWAERWCRPAVRFVPWQELDLAAHDLTEQQVRSAVQYLPVRSTSPVRSGAAAAARTLLRSRWPWRPLGALMLLPPFSWVAAVAYRLIAANRYRLPGGSPACAVPTGSPVHADSAVHADSDNAVSAQSLGDVGGGAHDAGAGPGRIELAERDHAD